MVVHYIPVKFAEIRNILTGFMTGCYSYSKRRYRHTVNRAEYLIIAGILEEPLEVDKRISVSGLRHAWQRYLFRLHPSEISATSATQLEFGQKISNNN